MKIPFGIITMAKAHSSGREKRITKAMGSAGRRDRLVGRKQAAVGAAEARGAVRALGRRRRPRGYIVFIVDHSKFSSARLDPSLFVCHMNGKEWTRKFQRNKAQRGEIWYKNCEQNMAGSSGDYDRDYNVVVDVKPAREEGITNPDFCLLRPERSNMSLWKSLIET